MTTRGFLLVLASAALLPGCRSADAVIRSDPSMIGVPGTSTSGHPVLFVLDTRLKRLAVYRTDGTALELIAARNIEYDLKLDSFRDASVEEVQVRRLRADWQETQGGP